MGNDKLIIKQKRARGEDGYKTFSIRVNEDLVEKLNLYLKSQDTPEMN